MRRQGIPIRMCYRGIGQDLHAGQIHGREAVIFPADQITDRTRLVIINTPHNPTGMCMTAEDMSELQIIAEEHDLLVLSDEVLLLKQIF